MQGLSKECKCRVSLYSVDEVVSLYSVYAVFSLYGVCSCLFIQCICRISIYSVYAWYLSTVYNYVVSPYTMYMQGISMKCICRVSLDSVYAVVSLYSVYTWSIYTLYMQDLSITVHMHGISIQCVIMQCHSIQCICRVSLRLRPKSS